MDSFSPSGVKVLERALDTLSLTVDIERLTKSQVISCLGFLNRLEPQISSEKDWSEYLTIRARLDKRLNEIDA